jgi:F1F0 ATPase subunit 2
VEGGVSWKLVAVEGLGGLIAGAALGAAYFYVLFQSVQSVAIARQGVMRAPVLGLAGLTLARIAAAAGVFWVLARLGAAPLLCGLAGFLLARGALRLRIDRGR